MGKKTVIEGVSFGDWLRQRRRNLDLTQQTLADQVGCARITLRRIESDTLKPSKELAWILLKRLGVPEEERTQWVSFARGVSGLPEKIPAVAERKPLNNLPASLTSFIGRKNEQADVSGLIRRHRLVTLTGAGGVGKTRLSLKVGEQVLEDFADGVWLVELASLTNPDLLPQALGMVFGVTSQGNRPLTDLLIDYLRPKRLLLLIDNCEHLLDACASFTDLLLKRCPDLKILITSREALGITGEAAYRVPSLVLPNLRQLRETFRQNESIRLFEERAQLAQTDFSLTLENIASVAQICYQLDGIPLAIELAAARVNFLSTEQIAAQLKECFQILTGGSRTALPRQQTIQASIDWSWSRLTELEQTLFRRLSVFVRDWSLESAQAVCGENGLFLTNALVNKSLVVAEESIGHQTRYHFHEIIRQYAADKLAQSGELDTIRWAHANAIAALLEKVKAAVSSPEEVPWFKKLDAELDNLRAAIEWTLSNNQPGLAFSTGALYQYWFQRTNQREPLSWLERAFSMDVALTTLERANALNGAGKLCNDLKLTPRARKYLKAALALFRKAKDRRGVSWCLNNLGVTAWIEKDFEKARQYYEKSLAYAEPKAFTASMTISNLGVLARIRGDWAQSWDCFLRSREICEQLGAEAGISYADFQLTSLAVVQRNLAEAEASFARELNTSWIQNNPVIRDFYSGILGYIYLLTGREDQARLLLKQALVACASAMKQSPNLGFPFLGFPFIFEGKARLELADGRPEHAAQFFGTAWHMREQENYPLSQMERPEYEAIIAATRSAIGARTFELIFDKGEAMSLKDAVVLALETCGV